MLKNAVVLLTVMVVITSANVEGGFRILRKIYQRCEDSNQILDCIKRHALRAWDRVLSLNDIKLMNGVNLVRTRNRTELENYREHRRVRFDKLNEHQISDYFYKSTGEFLSSYDLEISVPKLLEEGRGKGKRIHLGPLIAAMVIKGGAMAVAYKGIAVTAGAALLIGKMALILCVIMGLKKLASGAEGEKTTVEIVKHPTYSKTHTYSSSYEDDGHYHRSLSSAEDFGWSEKLMQRPYVRRS